MKREREQIQRRKLLNGRGSQGAIPVGEEREAKERESARILYKSLLRDVEEGVDIFAQIQNPHEARLASPPPPNLFEQRLGYLTNLLDLIADQDLSEKDTVVDAAAKETGARERKDTGNSGWDTGQARRGQGDREEPFGTPPGVPGHGMAVMVEAQGEQMDDIDYRAPHDQCRPARRGQGDREEPFGTPTGVPGHGMAVMVEAQGEQMDDIEHHMINAAQSKIGLGDVLTLPAE
ncbi:hypothetical protein RHGRI_003782 [Rhododendron griersonianum]|uniref:Uncharacterized protein n=1 Tax=Rhododendron griersonianum TaxID=479676 RepID=A0AAV6L8K1_9ERIC|nr:hypothetical protein RHGRI_003782 [Rhododendron griersonianum]